MGVQTSRNVDISRNSNGHISVMRETIVTRLGMLVVLHVLCMLIRPWQDPRSRSRSRADASTLWLWLQLGRKKPCTLEAMIVSPLAGLFYSARSYSFAKYWIHFIARFNGAHAFCYNPAGSEPIWMKFGKPWAQCLPLAMAHFGRDPRRSDSEANFLVW